MLTKWLDSFLLSPAIDWIQVEVTSRCNAACFYCPRTVYRDAWLNRDLSLRDFERLSPAFGKTDMIFLQGWGEPFLNPDIITMVKTAKNAGCKVGTTTNGMLLNEHMISQLVDCGMDILSFSLAGVDERSNAFRQGTNLDTILKTIQTVNETKRNVGTTLPAIHIAYILLRSGLEDIERLPLLLRGLHISQVVVSTLDFVPGKELNDESIIPSNSEEYEKLQSQLEAVKAESEQIGIPFHYRLHRPGRPNLMCTENIQRSFFVSSDGTVSPCVFTNLPISQETRISCNKERPYQPLTFGNIRDTGIWNIWQKRAYKNFRQTFHDKKLLRTCRNCPKLFVV
jgi:MoaA/NifB/PqqE/SkfB family radical SAM enzyme